MKKFNFSKLKKIISEIFLQSGSNVEESEIIANHLVEANLKGHDSHGVIRVKQYIELIKKGDIKLNQRINIIKEEDSFIHVDGNQGHGQSIIKQTMDLGIGKTKKNGHCILALKNLNLKPIKIKECIKQIILPNKIISYNILSPQYLFLALKILLLYNILKILLMRVLILLQFIPKQLQTWQVL